MKKLVTVFLSSILLVGFFACQKSGQGEMATPLNPSKLEVKQAEAILFNMNTAPANTQVKWEVNPNSNVQINVGAEPYSTRAAILFGAAGKYIVSATAGNVTTSTAVRVDTGIYHCPDTTKMDSLFHDSLRIRPSVFHGPKDTSGLVISAITTNKYDCLNNYLVSKLIVEGENYTIVYSGVAIPPNCQGGKAKAQGMQHIYPVEDGYHGFKIVLNGDIYAGYFIKTGNQYEFYWPHEEGVITISPLIVN